MIEYRGSERNRILLQPTKDGIAWCLFKNIADIYKQDANLGDEYVNWLRHDKIPALKRTLEDALVKEFMESGQEDEFWSEVTKVQDNFRKYEELITKRVSNLDFLKSYA